MLSLFPSLLSYQQLSPFIVRVTLGAVFVFWAYRTFRNKNGNLFAASALTSSPVNMKIIAIVEAAAGILLVVGLWTQVAALVAAIDLLIRLIERVKNRAFLTDGVNYYLILLVMALSLLVTGAGRLAFDLPL